MLRAVEDTLKSSTEFLFKTEGNRLRSVTIWFLYILLRSGSEFQMFSACCSLGCPVNA